MYLYMHIDIMKSVSFLTAGLPKVLETHNDVCCLSRSCSNSIYLAVFFWMGILTAVSDIKLRLKVSKLRQTLPKQKEFCYC